MAVAAVTRAASDAGEAVPVGPFTRHAIEGFRRTAAGDAPPRRGQARGLTADECATVLATCLRPRRERSAERKVRRAGLCYWCPAPAEPDRRMCRACAALACEKSRQLRAERIAAGRCSRCGGPGDGCQCRGRPAPSAPAATGSL